MNSNWHFSLSRKWQTRWGLLTACVLSWCQTAPDLIAQDRPSNAPWTLDRPLGFSAPTTAIPQPATALPPSPPQASLGEPTPRVSTPQVAAPRVAMPQNSVPNTFSAVRGQSEWPQATSGWSGPGFAETGLAEPRTARHWPGVGRDWFETPSMEAAPRVAYQWQRLDTPSATPNESEAFRVGGLESSPRTPNAATRFASSSVSEDERKLWARVPQPGEHFFDPNPQVDCGVQLLEPHLDDFSPDPIHDPLCYDGEKQIDVYAGKKLYATQRPLLEWGREQYGPGQFPRSLTFLGSTNLVTPQLLVYGDFRSALAANRVNGDTQSVWANRLNLDIDFEITSTERFHAFMGPLDSGNQFTRVEYDGGDVRFVPEFDPDIDFAFFEGDAGAIWGGFRGEVLPFTLPFAAGVFPMFVQNGYWLNDAFLGTAVTIPARNSALLDIANYDVTFFTAFDNVSSPAFGADDNVAKVYGVTSWIEAYNGYIELGYGFADDRTAFNRSYHSISAAYSRRYGALLSNSVRVIANAGQDPNGIPQSADGVFVVLENSLITAQPWTVVPYFNLYAGFDRPQSLARAAGAGGILNQTGINFETDGLTGYPTLDSSANNTWGGALGMNLLPQDFSQQLVAEFAFVQAFGEDATRIARGDQYGIGLRYQIPISNAVILRADAMHGFLGNEEDVSGIRFEFRHKF